MIQPGPCKARFFFEQRGVDFLAGKHERHEYGFTTPMLVRGQARQSVSAINQLLDRQFQEVILCHIADPDRAYRYRERHPAEEGSGSSRLPILDRLSAPDAHPQALARSGED